MKWLNNQRIGMKLGIGFAVMIIFMIFIGGMGILNIRSINSNLHEQ